MCSITFAILFGWHSHQSTDCLCVHTTGTTKIYQKFHYASLQSLEKKKKPLAWEEILAMRNPKPNTNKIHVLSGCISQGSALFNLLFIEWQHIELISAKHIGNTCQPPIITGIPQAPAWVLLHKQITSTFSKSKSCSPARLVNCSRCMALSTAKICILACSSRQLKWGEILNTHTCRGGMGDGS